MTTPKMTLGMPTHTDALGVWSTVMSVAIHHEKIAKQTELLIVDQAPDNPHGHEVRKLVERVREQFHSIKYVSAPEPHGSAPAKEMVFREAAGEFVLCIDCHILLYPMSLDRTLEYVFSHAHNTNDLICGPMVYEGGVDVSTHLTDKWSSNQWGQWAEARLCRCGQAVEILEHQNRVAYRHPHDLKAISFDGCPSCKNKLVLRRNTHPNVCAEESGFFSYAKSAPYARPFEVWAQGTGLIGMLKATWVGFPKGYRGFGAEEVILHHRVRRAGGKAVVLPWLRWCHRFIRPDGVKYSLSKYSQVRNYVLGFKDLGLDLKPVYDHFVGTETHGETLRQHLLVSHAVPMSMIDGKSEEQLREMHKELSLPQAAWDDIVQGKEEMPCFKKPGGCGGGAPAQRIEGIREAAVSKLPQYQTLEQWYAVAKNTPHDINEHCDTLRNLASHCKHITEFGKRHNVSTVALLAGAMDNGGKLVSYNPFRYPESIMFERMANANYWFRTGDSLKVDIEETDMLFIDTIHRGDRLYAELLKHAPRVRRYIVMHDTKTYGDFGDGSQPPHQIVPGLLFGLRKYMRENPQWSVIADHENNHGLTVISCQDGDKEKLPGAITMAWNFALAKTNHALRGGTTPEEQFKKRLEICTVCTKRNNERCARCGCPVDEKASWVEQECPIGKWAKEGV